MQTGHRGGHDGGGVGREKRTAVPTPAELHGAAVVVATAVPLSTSVSTDRAETGTVGTVVLEHRQRPPGDGAADFGRVRGFRVGVPSSSQPLRRAKTRARPVPEYRLSGRLRVPPRRAAADGRTRVSRRRVSNDHGRGTGRVTVSARQQPFGFRLQTSSRVASVRHRRYRGGFL